MEVTRRVEPASAQQKIFPAIIIGQPGMAGESNLPQEIEQGWCDQVDRQYAVESYGRQSKEQYLHVKTA